MYGRGFGLRWIVLAAVVIFALVSLGSLILSRYSAVDQALDATPYPPVSATSASPLTFGPSQKASPAPSLPSGSLIPAPPRSTAVAGTATAIESSDDLLALVSKQFALPDSYVPPDLVPITTIRATSANLQLRRRILPALEKLVLDAKSLGYELVITSAYRSYGEQAEVRSYWERSLGKEEADKVSALAGHSEHQLGTTVDLTSPSVGFDLTEKFGATPEGKWLRENAHRYGFVISYPEGKERVTGYAYEPWHIRFVGIEHATAIVQKGITLDEYLRSRG